MPRWMLPLPGVTNTFPAFTRTKPSDASSTSWKILSSMAKFCARLAVAPVWPPKLTPVASTSWLSKALFERAMY
jgi:hypothetical protein